MTLKTLPPKKLMWPIEFMRKKAISQMRGTEESSQVGATNMMPG